MLKGLILDMDGVLVDSRLMLLDYYSKIFESAGYSLPIQAEDVLECFHMSKREALITLSGLDDESAEGRLEVDRLLVTASETTRDTDYLFLREGVEDFLFKAREKLSLSIVTNADAETPREFFDKLPAAAPLFSAVVTAEDKIPLKPAPNMPNHAMKMMGTKPDETAFGGDSKTDILAGKAAKVTTILVQRPGQDQELDTRGWEGQPDIKAYSLEDMYVAVAALTRACKKTDRQVRVY